MDSVFGITSKNLVIIVQSLSYVQLFVIPRTTAYQAFLSFAISPGQPAAMVRVRRSLLHTTPGWRTIPGWPAAAEGPGSPPLLGVLQHCSVPANNYSRVFAQAPGWHIDQGLYTQEDRQ